MATMQELDEALDPIREGVEADGARLRVSGRQGDVIDLVLEQPPDACERCMLPVTELESLAVDTLREVDPALVSVRVSVVQAPSQS